MPFELFYKKFPEIAEKETRRIHALNDPNLPAGEYALLESYCDEAGCDCRRVFLNVVNLNTGELKAVIAYGWESKNFYIKWLGDNDPDLIRDIQGPILNLASPQSEIAPELLNIVKVIVLKDRNYVNRLKKHYKMYKDLIDSIKLENVIPLREVPERKMGRNSPCPCGSGKKYKRCCEKKITQSISKHKANLEKKQNKVVIKPLADNQIKLSPEEEHQIRTLLHQKSKIQAIQRVKEISGCDLRTSINYIESFLTDHKDEFPSDLRNKKIMPSGQISLDPFEREEVLNLINEKGKVEAIKRLIEITGAGLKESKDYVDTLQSRI